MNDHKITFTLKQHTPLIHFQHEQPGATLRATELKPKLDRFLLEKEPDLPYIKNANGSRSLSYKVTIEQDRSNAEDIPERDPLFFANMGEGEKKRFKQHSKKFHITFFSFEPKVIEAIDTYFKAFLSNTNFGTRQSKGFGSFYLADTPFDPKEIEANRVYTFTTGDWKRDIGLYYQFLRQGINLTKRSKSPFYTKPAIFAYAKSKGWQWEKKSIKEAYFSNALQTQQSEHPQSDVAHYTSKEKYLMRDLLGLSSSQEWLSYRETITKEHTKIERYRSPITFKVVDDKVYFWADKNALAAMLDQTFAIKHNNRGDLKLDTPKTFDLDMFLQFAVGIDLSRHIESSFYNTFEYKRLSTIQNELKACL